MRGLLAAVALDGRLYVMGGGEVCLVLPGFCMVGGRWLRFRVPLMLSCTAWAAARCAWAVLPVNADFRKQKYTECKNKHTGLAVYVRVLDVRHPWVGSLS